MNNWSLRSKILALIISIVVGLVLFGLFNMRTTSRVAEGGETIYKVNMHSLEEAFTAKESFQTMAITIYQHLLSTSLDEMAEYEGIIQGEYDKVNLTLQNLAAEAGAEELEYITKIQEALQRYGSDLQDLLMLSRENMKDIAMQITYIMREDREVAATNLDLLVEYNQNLADMQNELNYQTQAEAQMYTIASIITVTLLAIFAGLYILRSILKPVRAVEDVAQALAAGDLTACVDVQSRDELGRMGMAINKAMANLKDLVGQVAQIAEQVAASAQQLSASSEEVGQSSQQVAETVNQLARGADEQAREAANSSKTVGEMIGAIQQVANAAQSMVNDSNVAVENSQQGRALVGEAADQMSAISDATGQTADSVNALGEMSVQIGQIVEVITSIAEQTNLLALNAAIEAARAGEQGRGFAVVAEEVRKLAEQSRLAAEQIAALISNTQSETEKAVQAMVTGSEQVNNGIEIVTKTGQAFEAILESIQTVVGRIHEVSAASQQLSSGSDDVVHSVGTMAATTQESAAAVEEISASTQEQNASVEEIAASAESLSRLGRELQQAIQIFRV